YWKSNSKSIHLIDDGNSNKSFSFDRVFAAEETTNQLYQGIAKPLVVSSVEGYNGTIFAYGQTSSGKTFTMMGSDLIPGVIPLAVEDVFQTIKNCPKKEFLLRVSYMEIYNETVTDLLVDSWKRKPLEVRETINKNIYVADLTEELVTNPEQALAWIRKGEKNRHYGKTKMNQRSSRSHTIFRMILESRERSDPASGENADGAIIVSHLNLVDLAGSERASQTGAEGTRFKEGCNINRSLFTLGQVIKKLTDESQKGFTNYRDSKLTRILQNSLGGNAKTVIICTITPVALDETLSTLQFASTAKKMKNDPHVTEVSDDGALLKRYRNEIVDLKRRLHEVSSVTHTTATEKEFLAQLLQEKDQLQREQEDRIKNLTKLIITSSTLMPKRRVTWGGKMIRLARPSVCGSSDLSFADPVTRKRRADRSCLTELGEGKEEHSMAEERVAELELQLQLQAEALERHEILEKTPIAEERIAELELQLQTEAQQKNETLEKIQIAEERVAELELQLQMQTEAQQKHETLEKIQIAEERVAELELQLQTEAQQKHEATEKVEMLEFRVADLERQLEEQSHIPSETEQVCWINLFCFDLARLCLVTFALILLAYVPDEKRVCRDHPALQEKRETDEFESLEEEFRKEHEVKLLIYLHQTPFEVLRSTDERAGFEFELKKKSDFAEELQCMSGKDLVQEVAKLRRSLDDAEGLSRDTKKEWAFLRSENIALEERVVTLSVNHDKLDNEVNSLRYQLETEKSRFRKMQTDLQKELNVVFDENTKLTTLLDGKVPKNLIDSVELERTVSNLNKELTAAREAEEALRAQLEELSSFQALPEKVDSLTKQVCELTEELCAVQTQRDGLLSSQAQCREEAQQLRDLLQTSQDEVLKIQADFSAAALREKELSEQHADVTQQLDSLRSDLDQSDTEKSQLMQLESTRAERDALLFEKEAGSQTSTEEMEKLLSRVSSLSEERDQLQETLEGLRQEKQQLKAELEDRMEMMIENQEELRVSQEKIKVLQDEINMLRSQKAELESNGESAFQSQELQNQIQILTKELESVRAERDGLLSERTADAQTHSEEMEKLLSRVTSLSEERDQLQETLEGLRQEKQQLKAELEDRMETLQAEVWESFVMCSLCSYVYSSKTITEQKKQLEDDLQHNMNEVRSLLITMSYLAVIKQSLTEKLEHVEAERDGLLSEKEASCQTSTEEMEKLLSRVTSLSEERDQLQETLEGLRREKQQLKAELEDRMETLQAEVCLTFSVETERDGLLSEKKASCQTSTEEMEKLLSRVTSLSEERDQLQETLEGLRQEKRQERTELEDRMETLQTKVGFGLCFSVITQLEYLVSSQQAEISKWKSRAIKLKGKTKNENPSPPCTPTKRGLPMTSDSSNFLNSPKNLLDSPKSRFFDVGGSSELLSRTCPKQFFDNSSLGTIPGKLLVKFTSLFCCSSGRLNVIKT
uniref:Centromere-associated protein E n=1 Tax=Sparus aurata TaxID=8175 RepID=A0A671W2N3_SPAAU